MVPTDSREREPVRDGDKTRERERGRAVCLSVGRSVDWWQPPQWTNNAVREAKYSTRMSTGWLSLHLCLWNQHLDPR